MTTGLYVTGTLMYVSDSAGSGEFLVAAQQRNSRPFQITDNRTDIASGTLHIRRLLASSSAAVAIFEDSSKAFPLLANAQDVFFYVSGTQGLTGSFGEKAVFGGDVYISGSLNIGGTIVSAPTTGTIKVMIIGDSLVGGSTPAPGGSRISLLTIARSKGGDVQLTGPVISTNAGYQFPYEPWCAGYAGETIENLTTRVQAGGSIYVYVNTFGAPDIIFWRLGTNNVGTDSAATMKTKRNTFLTALDALCPNARKVAESLPKFYPPAVGSVSANAILAQYNSDLANDIPNRSVLHSYIDSSANLTIADTWTDGVHLRPSAQAKIGSSEWSEIERLFPNRRGLTMPRPFKPRTKQASVMFTSQTAHNVTIVDSGFELPSSSFLFGARIYPTNITSSVNTTTAIVQCGVANYLDGWLLAYDQTQTPQTLNFYTRGNGAVVAQTSFLEGNLYWLFVHGDRAASIVSFWLAQQIAKTPQGAYGWVVSCVGAGSGSIPWPSGSAGATTYIGKNPSFGGFAGTIDNVFWCTGSAVPSFLGIRDVIESVVYEDSPPPGRSAYYRMDEGSGANVLSSLSLNITGTLVGQRSSAGVIAWPSDDSVIQNNAGKRSIMVITGAYTMQQHDDLVIASNLATHVTTSLPAAPLTGSLYTIKDGDGTANTKNIVLNGNGRNIDGGSTATIVNAYTSLTVAFNGTQWSII